MGLNACSDSVSMSGGNTSRRSRLNTEDKQDSLNTTNNNASDLEQNTELPNTKELGPEPDPDPDAVFNKCNNQAVLPVYSEVYRLPVGTQRLPNFDNLEAETEVCLSNYDIPVRDWVAGFDGLDKELIEWFALVTKTTLVAPESGRYKFYLLSDDGSRLFIDGEEIINNDGG